MNDRQANRLDDVKEALGIIDNYLSGELSVFDASYWGLSKMTEVPEITDHPTDQILILAYRVLLMLSESEPVEFRSSLDDVLEARSPLLSANH